VRDQRTIGFAHLRGELQWHADRVRPPGIRSSLLGLWAEENVVQIQAQRGEVLYFTIGEAIALSFEHRRSPAGNSALASQSEGFPPSSPPIGDHKVDRELGSALLARAEIVWAG